MKQEKILEISTNYKFALSLRRKVNKRIYVAGRATTKSSFVAPFTLLEAAMEMPRCHIALASVTFEKIYTSILPLIIDTWEKWGIMQDIHFVVGKDNPSFPRCYYEPKDRSRIIKLWNGTVISLGSFNDAGFFNGKNIQFLVIDELRFIKQTTFVDGVAAAMRGAKDKFEHCPLYLGMVLLTDRPKSKSERWITDFKKNMQPEKLKQIDAILDRLDFLESIKNDNDILDKIDEKLNAEINFLTLSVNYLRQRSLELVEVSTIENVDMLGWQAIENMYYSMDLRSFERQVLNLEEQSNSDLFYPYFDENAHTIDMSRPAFIQNLLKEQEKIKNKDSRWTDIDTSLPLILTNDANTYFNCLVVGQIVNFERKQSLSERKNSKIQLRVIAYIHCSAPDNLKTCAEIFCNYFRFHENKNVFYAFDTTMTGNQEAVLPEELKKEINPKNVIIKTLKQNGYSVVEYPMGNTQKYRYRFDLWSQVLNSNYFISVLIDKNLKSLISALENAERQELHNGEIKKVKKGEGKPDINQAQSTHCTDALDLMLHFTVNFVHGLAMSNSSNYNFMLA